MTLRMVAALAAVVLAGPAPDALAQTARTVRDGVYTEAQAARGQTLYGEQCASCHGASLEGAQGPPLTGDTFVRVWYREPLSTLVNKVRHTMPASDPGQLTPQQSADIVAYVLGAGGFPAGTTALGPDEAAWAQIGWPADLVPRDAPPVPDGNLAQLMRGVFFPNSNLIFTVQTHDPAAPAENSGSDSASGFSFVDWGAGIYTGWEIIDNAAIALMEASPLMLRPGRRCENGRPVPVDDPEWVDMTAEMIAAAREAYRASQLRSQEAVSEATGRLSDACFSCHRAYRDRRRRGAAPDPADPSNKAARCVR